MLMRKFLLPSMNGPDHDLCLYHRNGKEMKADTTTDMCCCDERFAVECAWKFRATNTNYAYMPEL